MSSSHQFRALLSFCVLGLALCAASCASTGAPRAKLVCENDGYGKQCASLGQSFHSPWSWTGPISQEELGRVDALIDATVVTAREMQAQHEPQIESFLIGKRVDGTYVAWGPKILEDILEDIPETYQSKYLGEFRANALPDNLMTVGAARIEGQAIRVEVRAKKGPCLGYELWTADAEPELSPRRLGDRKNGWRCTSTIASPSQAAVSFL